MYFMNKNKEKEATKQKERDEQKKWKDVNMAAPSFDRKILNDQHKREKDAKAKERAQPGENAKFDMAVREGASTRNTEYRVHHCILHLFITMHNRNLREHFTISQQFLFLILSKHFRMLSFRNN